MPYDLSNLALAELYGWDGSQWQWLPAQVQPGGTEIAAQVDTLPAMFVVAEAQPSDPRIAFGTSISKARANSRPPMLPSFCTGCRSTRRASPAAPTRAMDPLGRAHIPCAGQDVHLNVVDGVARSDWVREHYQ